MIGFSTHVFERTFKVILSTDDSSQSFNLDDAICMYTDASKSEVGVGKVKIMM